MFNECLGHWIHMFLSSTVAKIFPASAVLMGLKMLVIFKHVLTSCICVIGISIVVYKSSYIAGVISNRLIALQRMHPKLNEFMTKDKCFLEYSILLPFIRPPSLRMRKSLSDWTLTQPFSSFPDQSATEITVRPISRACVCSSCMLISVNSRLYSRKRDSHLHSRNFHLMNMHYCLH